MEKVEISKTQTQAFQDRVLEVCEQPDLKEFMVKYFKTVKHLRSIYPKDFMDKKEKELWTEIRDLCKQERIK